VRAGSRGDSNARRRRRSTSASPGGRFERSAMRRGIRAAIAGAPLANVAIEGGHRYVIAVGNRVTPVPPHRSVRAGLPHTAPTSGV